MEQGRKLIKDYENAVDTIKKIAPDKIEEAPIESIPLSEDQRLLRESFLEAQAEIEGGVPVKKKSSRNRAARNPQSRKSASSEDRIPRRRKPN